MHENMSDLWTFPASSPPPIAHQSSWTHTLPPFSTSLFRNHGSPSPAKVSSPHIYPPQNTSPHMCPPQVTSPNLGLRTQASSFQFPQSQIISTHLTQPQVTSPHLSPQMEVSPSHLFYQSQITSPHLPSAQGTSSYHLGSPQVNSPLLHSPHVTSPHLTPQPQHFLYNQNLDLELDYTDWNKCEASSDLSCYLNGGSFSYQNQSPSPLDIHLQNQYSTSETPHTDEVESTTKAYNTHMIHAGGVFDQSDLAGRAQHTWDSVSPTLPQVRCPPLGSNSAGDPMGRWSSIEVSSSPAEDFPNNQFYHEGYHGINNQQPFCSPTTPGPSPHYPQTPTVSSPGPQMHARTDRIGCPHQASQQLNRDPTSGLPLNDPSSFFPSSDKTQPHPHQRSQHLLQSQSEPAEEAAANSLETSFSPQKRGPAGIRSSPSPGPSAGTSCNQECGGRRRRQRKGNECRTDWNWMAPIRGTGVLDPRCRLMCMVCNRDFKSLPALNGHMRSHSGFRSPTRLKKDTSPPTQSPVPIVMPVSVAVQTRGMSGQRKGSVPPPASGGAVLYRSLMHLNEQEGKQTGANENGDVDGTTDLGHYTPPPMLCPERAGPGLYCSLPARWQQRAERIKLHSLGDLVPKATDSPPSEPLASENVKPRINFGKSYQAEIPSLRDKKYARADSHNALLLWTPYDELERPINQQRVEALLMMALSSVVPGARAGPEYALQLLSQSNGDFLLTVEKLLSHPETSTSQTGVRWSAAEKRLLVKSLQIHHKDFSSIQKAVRSKSLAECVEYYYLWKKKLGLKAPAKLTISLPETNGHKVSKSQKAS